MGRAVDYNAKAEAAADYYRAIGALREAQDKLYEARGWVTDAIGRLGSDPENALGGRRTRKLPGERSRAILDALPGRTAEVAERIGVSHSNAMVGLLYLEKQGKVMRSGGLIRSDGRPYGQTWERAEVAS